jgi:hypothetical protein
MENNEQENQNGDITVVVNSGTVTVDWKRPGNLHAMPGFTPFRKVGNFGLVIEGPVSEVNVTVRVKYTKADLDNAQTINSLARKLMIEKPDRSPKDQLALRLAFWDGNTWVPITNEEYGFKLEPPDENGDGEGVFFIIEKEWKDPSCAWGG